MIFTFLLTAVSAISIEIIVLAFNRPNELKMTLASLSRLLFVQEKIKLTIHIDGPAADDLVYEVFKLASQFSWIHGNKTVVQHEQNRGILGQWIECWYPNHDGEYALIIEDDVEVSPMTIPYLKRIIQLHGSDDNLYGIALQCSQWQLGINERRKWRRLDLVDESYPLLLKYPAVGTWGQLLFPKPWKQFLKFAQKTEKSSHKLEGLITEEWDRRSRRLFTPVFMRWVMRSGYTNLYTNIPRNMTLAFSRKPPGVNFSETQADNGLERFPTELQVLELMKKGEAAENLSACFDRTDLTAEEQLALYGIVIEFDEEVTVEGKKKLDCVLKQWRIYPLKSPSTDYPRAIIHDFDGYLNEDPIKLIKKVKENTVIVSKQGERIMTILIKADSNYQKLELDIIESLDGPKECDVIKCPYKEGLYPDKLFSAL